MLKDRIQGHGNSPRFYHITKLKMQVNNMKMSAISQYDRIHDDVEYKDNYISKCRKRPIGNGRVTAYYQFSHDQLQKGHEYKTYASGEQNNIEIHISIHKITINKDNSSIYYVWIGQETCPRVLSNNQI